MDSFFSIVIPTYNRPVELLRCLKLLENQIFKNFEVIIVDDCSTNIVDLSSCVLDYDFVYHRLNKNIGAAGARNVGVSLAKSDWIVFLDDDDVFEPDKLLRIRAEIDKSPNSEIVYHTARIHMVNEGVEYLTSIKKESTLALNELLAGNYIGGAPVITIKKDLFESVCGFSEHLRSIEDYHFLLKLAVHNKVNVCFIDEPLTTCFYYTGRTSVSKHIQNLKFSLCYIKEHYVSEKTSRAFKTNAFGMMAHAHLMNLNRLSSYYYLMAFLKSCSFRFFVASLLSLISPKLLIFLRTKL